VEPDANATAWPKAINALTLFVEDLDATKAFNRQVFGVPMIYEDDDSAVFNFGNTIVNLL
jgi:catechol-2,3-dioxygenase